MGLIDKLLNGVGIVHNKKFHCKIGNVKVSRIGPLPLEGYSVDSDSVKLRDSKYKISCSKMNLNGKFIEDTMYGSVTDCAGTCLESPRFQKEISEYTQEQAQDIMNKNKYAHKWCPYLELSELASQGNQTAKIKNSKITLNF